MKSYQAFNYQICIEPWLILKVKVMDILTRNILEMMSYRVKITIAIR